MSKRLPARVATAVAVAIACVLFAAPTATGATGEPITLQVFRGNDIHFLPANPDTYATAEVRSEDNGRVIARSVDLDTLARPVRITACVTIHPIPKDETTVHDPWDRAGNVRLSKPGMADVEIVKFVTAYGGLTEHTVDVSHLAPLLEGPVEFRGFIDTWVSPAWKMDFRLTFEPAPEPGHPGETNRNPDWAFGLVYEQNVTEELLRDGPLAIEVEVPETIGRVVLHYLVSGHCTDGRDDDEFVSKDNVISVDGIVVHRYKPWRDDCRRFREINPYTRRWTDGYWSSDYSRSGWCPGDWVPPLALDLSDHLTPGKHVVTVNVEDVRPKDDDGHLGYWRVSSHLVGWED
jgi:hypothetical protein